MQTTRFSTAILSLVIALLAIASTILLIPAFNGANEALQYEIKHAYERDQRTLNSLMKAQFKNIELISQELSNTYEVHLGLNKNDPVKISQVVEKLLSDASGQHIDAIVVEDIDSSSIASINASMLNLKLPLVELSKNYSPLSIWTSVYSELEGKKFSLLRLTLPIVDEQFGQVIGKLHTYVLLNDNYWIINQLQKLFGSSAISLSSREDILDSMESHPEQLHRLHAPITIDDGVLTTENNILREHYLHIGNSDEYTVRSLLPNSAERALLDSYTSNLDYAILLVVMLGIIAMLIIRYLITNPLHQITRYAEHIPESGSPSPFKGGRFNEFNRVGIAIEKMLQRIREHDKHLSSIVDNSPDLIFIKDTENRYRLVSKQMAKLANTNPEQMVGGLDSDFWTDDQITKVRQWDQQVLSNLLPVQYEIPINTDKGSRTFLVSKFPILDDHNQAYAIGGIATDITKEKESEALIWHQTNFDALTGLPNRRMFIDRVEQNIEKAHDPDLISAVLFINLDHFKEINDSKGRKTGDLLIRDTAKRLQTCMQNSSSVARIGGDEFAIFLSDLKHLNSVEKIAKNLLSELAKPFKLGNEITYLSSSIGIAFYPSDANTADTLIQCANQAMYTAKEQGRNRRNYFTPALQESVQSKIIMANDLRTALTDNELTVFYQPIISLIDNSVHKAEALIRWQHPIIGFISPAEFIPVAEENGLIVDIGNWVFRQAARQVKSWRESLQTDFQISVNKSPAQFRYEGDCLYDWFDFLHQQGLPGNAIVVEMTEGLLMDTNPIISSKLFLLSDAGMEVALDDFGTGYSSLSYLKKFDIDYLKIDQSFVKNLENDADGAALCESIIMMAHRLGIKVIAEGVETHQQHDLLKSWGCDYAQGFLFSKPIPAGEFEEWFTDRKSELVTSD